MKYTKSLAIISGSFVGMSAISKAVQIWKPIFSSSFTYWTALVGFVLGGYCIVWLMLQVTKENWKIAFQKNTNRPLEVKNDK